jgi:hypothetical protein
MVKGTIGHGCEISTVDNRSKEKSVKNRNGFLEKSCKNSQSIKSKKVN